MNDKIIVEFDREELEEMCEKEGCWLDSRNTCKHRYCDLIRCNLKKSLDFKIKEQNNGNNKI